MAHNTLILITIFISLTITTTGRHITTTNLINDGVNELELLSCDPTYGFLPCTTTVFGNLFLILAYGYLMFIAATYLSKGSELMLEILGPGIVGGLFLPILGALPDALLILGTKL